MSSTTSTSNVGIGSLSTSGGSTKLSGTLFGIDVNTLIDSLTEAKSVPNTLRQDKIDTNTKKISAYSDLRTKLTALQTATTALRNPRVTSGDSDAFDAKQTLSRESGSIAASSLYGVSAQNGAANGTYSVTINRVAKADTISGTKAITASSATPVTTSGNLVLEGTNIALTSSMTLTQIKDAINNVSSTTKVTASIVQAGTNDYRLLLKGSQTGNAISISDDQTGSILTDLGLAASGATDTSLSAEIILDGVTVTRTSNSVNDLITGVSMELYQADIGKPISLTISDNLSGVSDAVTSFITAYNDIVDYVQKQRQTDTKGTIGEDQLLYNDGLMLSVYRGLQSTVSTGASGVTTGALKSLGDIGIDLTQDGKLEVSDDTKFEDALLSNLDQVKALFGFSANESSGIQVVDRPDKIPAALSGKTITVRVTATDASGLPTAAEFEVDGVVTAARIENGFVKGVKGTDFENFAVGYSGGVVSGTPFTGTFKPTQGIADQIAGVLEPVLNQTDGSLKNATDTLTTTNTRLEDQISTLKTQLDLYRARLTLQFQAAQEAISALESQKSSIKSFTDSLNGNG